MRLLVDENFPGEAVAALRRGGQDVLWVRTEMPGASDETVLRRAHAEQRLLLTFDKDFGAGIPRGAPLAERSMLFRIEPRDPAHVAAVAMAVLATRESWAGLFTVIEPKRIRTVPLPPLRAI